MKKIKNFIKNSLIFNNFNLKEEKMRIVGRVASCNLIRQHVDLSIRQLAGQKVIISPETEDIYDSFGEFIGKRVQV